MNQSCVSAESVTPKYRRLRRLHLNTRHLSNFSCCGPAWIITLATSRLLSMIAFPLPKIEYSLTALNHRPLLQYDLTITQINISKSDVDI